MKGTPGITMPMVSDSMVTAVGMVISFLVPARALLLSLPVHVVGEVVSNAPVGTLMSVTTMGRGPARQDRRSRQSRRSRSNVRQRRTVPETTHTPVRVIVTMPMAVDAMVTGRLVAIVAASEVSLSDVSAGVTGGVRRGSAVANWGVVNCLTTRRGSSGTTRVDGAEKNNQATWNGVGAGKRPVSSSGAQRADQGRHHALIGDECANGKKASNRHTFEGPRSRPASATNASASQDDTPFANKAPRTTDGFGLGQTFIETLQAGNTSSTGQKATAEATPPGGRRSHEGSTGTVALGPMPGPPTSTAWRAKERGQANAIVRQPICLAKTNSCGCQRATGDKGEHQEGGPRGAQREDVSGPQAGQESLLGAQVAVRAVSDTKVGRSQGGSDVGTHRIEKQAPNKVH